MQPAVPFAHAQLITLVPGPGFHACVVAGGGGKGYGRDFKYDRFYVEILATNEWLHGPTLVVLLDC